MDVGGEGGGREGGERVVLERVVIFVAGVFPGGLGFGPRAASPLFIRMGAIPTYSTTRNYNLIPRIATRKKVSPIFTWE